MNTQNLLQKNGTLLTVNQTVVNWSNIEDPIKFLKKSIESSLCDYSDAYNLITRNITITKAIAVPVGYPACSRSQRKQPLTAAAQVAFKNYAPFKDRRTEINDTFVSYVDLINIAMSMCNLIEYSDNYSDFSESLCGFKRDDVVNNADVTNDDMLLHLSTKQTLLLVLK